MPDRQERGFAEKQHRNFSEKQERGFAAMSEAKQREIARKGGMAVSENRQHMSEIGRKGGESVSRDRQHMAQIGREGGKSSHSSRSGQGTGDLHNRGQDEMRNRAEEVEQTLE